MPRHKPYAYVQGKCISVFFDKRILPGTLEYSLHHLVNNELDLDLTIFNDSFKNDETGAPAYDPKILLKIILFAYSCGIVSSRKIAQVCREKVVFMALSVDTRPHLNNIADSLSLPWTGRLSNCFLEVPMVCVAEGLIGRGMFAIDSCKLPSNAAKEWSGTRSGFKQKADKTEKAIGRMPAKHGANDQDNTAQAIVAKEEKYVKTLRMRAKNNRDWLPANDDKMGKAGKPIQSKITLITSRRRWRPPRACFRVMTV